MFGGNGMMKKLQEMQQKVEETKARLDTITVEGKASNGKVTVIMTGNRKVNSISINEKSTGGLLLRSFSQFPLILLRSMTVHQ